MLSSKVRASEFLAYMVLGFCAALIIDNPKLIEDSAINLMSSALVFIWSKARF